MRLTGQIPSTTSFIQRVDTSELPRGQQRMAVSAMSKLITASIGDIAVIMSRSSTHKHYALADLEWMVLPAVLTSQFFVTYAEEKETGARAPLAFVTSAKVSEEIDDRLSEHDSRQAFRLKPNDWCSGANYWIVDLVGDPRALRHAIDHVCEHVWKNEKVTLSLISDKGGRKVATLEELRRLSGKGTKFE